MTQTTKPSVAVYEVAPYGDVSELLTHSTTRYCLIRQDSTVIGDLSLAEANLFAGALDVLGSAKAFLAAMDDDRIRKLCIGLDIDIYTIGARLIDAITKAEGRDS